jgi:hypothetical protein
MHSGSNQDTKFGYIAECGTALYSMVIFKEEIGK